MKKPFIFLSLSLAATAAAAQTTVKGVLLDSLSRAGEPYATVRILDPKGAIVTNFLTDENGAFSQTIHATGAHRILFSAVGRRTVERSVTLGAPTLSLDTLYISSIENTLEAATVTAQKALVKMETDKVTYDLASDVDSKTMTLLDMLRKVPLVVVDGQDNITVNGSGNFVVHVDGKPSPMFQQNTSQVMKSIPASYVRHIEVITNPGAKYDAEGVGGVLNLITAQGASGGQQRMDGYNGSLEAGMFNLGQRYNAFLNVQKKKVTWTFSATHNVNSLDGLKVGLVSEQDTPAGKSVNTVKGENDTHNYYSMVNAGLGYQLDDHNLFNVNVSGSRFANRQTNHLTQRFSGGFYGAGSGFDHLSKQRGDNYSLSVSADYQHTFPKHEGRMLTFSYLFSYSPNTSKNEELYSNGTTTLYDTTNRLLDGDAYSMEHLAQVDYVLPFAKVMKLNTGLKYTGRKNSSQQDWFYDRGGQYVLMPALATDYRQYSHIAAAYAEYEAQLKKWSLRAGLRYEHTWQRSDFKIGTTPDFHIDYGNLVPSASLSYAISQLQNLGLTYSMRISRPGLWYLNPALSSSASNVKVYGNPNLEAEKTHSLGLVYNFFSPLIYFNVQLNHAFNNNAIEQYSFYDADHVYNQTYGNVVKSRTSGFSLFVGFNPSQKTRIQLNTGFGYDDIRSDQLGYRNHGWTKNVMLGLQQTLWWKLKFSGNLIYRSRSYSLQGWNSGFKGLMGTLSRSFFKDKFDVSLFGMYTFGGRLKQESYLRGNDFSTMQTVKIPLKIIGVTLKWSFGNMKVKERKVSRTIENDDLKGGGDKQSSTIPGM